jgi:hypothetical protein
MRAMLSLVSALVIVVAFGASAFSSERHKTDLSCKMLSPDLPLLLKKADIKRSVDLETRIDLKLVVAEAHKRFTAIGVDCFVSRVSEVYLQQDQLLVIAGYELFADCEDAPTPAIAAYFDVNKCFLGVLDLAN